MAIHINARVRAGSSGRYEWGVKGDSPILRLGALSRWSSVSEHTEVLSRLIESTRDGSRGFWGDHPGAGGGAVGGATGRGRVSGVKNWHGTLKMTGTASGTPVAALSPTSGNSARPITSPSNWIRTIPGYRVDGDLYGDLEYKRPGRGNTGWLHDHIHADIQGTVGAGKTFTLILQARTSTPFIPRITPCKAPPAAPTRAAHPGRRANRAHLVVAGPERQNPDAARLGVRSDRSLTVPVNSPVQPLSLI